MPRARFISLARFFLYFSVACLLASARIAGAFPINTPPADAVEYYNQITGHYFVTASNAEMTGIENGLAGPGWVRTGYGFRVYSYPLYSGGCGAGCTETVRRFYGPAPNSHFFTINADEAAILERPGTGWIPEGIAFYAARTGADGTCGTYSPVYRLYNNRFAYNDSNHRFVASASERARMISTGWLDEGVAFCALGASDIPIKSFAFLATMNNGKIQPSAVCEDETRNVGACMALNNLSPPTKRLPYTGPGGEAAVYQQYTGLNATETFIASNLDTPVAATTVFVQQIGTYQYGIHVDTIQRGPAVYTSVNPLYQFRTQPDADGTDRRVFPFSNMYGTETQISLRFDLRLKKLNTRNSVSHAFGHPTLEFTDRKSGRNLYFTSLVYGTVLANDYLAPDVTTGKVIVGTTMRPGSSYMRSLGRDYFPAQSGFLAADAGEGGSFEMRMNRDEFRNVLAAARTIYPDLSPEPSDYLLDNYHFNNEIYGDGEIGLNITGFRLEIVRR